MEFQDFTGVFTSTSNPDVISLEFNGENITLFYDLDSDSYYGTNGNLFALFEGTFESSGGGLWSGFGFIGEDDADSAFLWAVPFHTGFNSDPAKIDTRFGNATYAGVGEIRYRSDDVNSLVAGGYSQGTLTLNADFDANEVSGSVDLDGDPFDASILQTTMVLDKAAIAGNAFAGTVGLTPSDFAASSLTADYSGMFYETNGTAVGITVTGTGVDQVSGENILLIGGFAGE